VCVELKCDFFHYNQLLTRFSILIARLNLRMFLAEARHGFFVIWRGPYFTGQNDEAILNAKQNWVLARLCRGGGPVELLGPWALPVYLALSAVAFFLFRRAWQRCFLLYVFPTVMSGMALNVLLDINDGIRHTMAYRSFNSGFIVCVGGPVPGRRAVGVATVSDA